jgi:hypothetical protein
LHPVSGFLRRRRWFSHQPCRGIEYRAVGRINLASLYVLNAAQDRLRLIEVLVGGP